jgi:hypothetical protein
MQFTAVCFIDYLAGIDEDIIINRRIIRTEPGPAVVGFVPVLIAGYQTTCTDQNQQGFIHA